MIASEYSFILILIIVIMTKNKVSLVFIPSCQIHARDRTPYFSSTVSKSTATKSISSSSSSRKKKK
jgi:hypothetical protein